MRWTGCLHQLIETAVKNCNFTFHSLVGSRDFLPDIIGLADGKKVGLHLTLTLIGQPRALKQSPELYYGRWAYA